MNNNQTCFMRATLLKRAWRTFGHAPFAPQSRGGIVMVALLLAAANLSAGTVVNWVSGGPNPFEPAGVGVNGDGYRDGDTILDAEFNTPCGIAVDITGNFLLVADRNNNAIRVLDFDNNWTSTFLTFIGPNLVTNLFHNPIGVAIDSSYNIFVLNRGNGNNGNVLEFDSWGDLIATNAANLTNAAGMALDPSDNIYVTIKSNMLLKITSPGVSSVVATIANAGTFLQGIVFKHNGLLAVCDSGRNGIYLIDPATGIVTTNAGFHGAGDFIHTANNIDPISQAKFFQPTGVAETGDGSLIVTDFGNHRVKVVTSTTVTNLYGVTSNDWVYLPNTPPYEWPGFVDGTVVVPDQLGGVAARQPFGVALAPDGTVYVTEDYYHIIRHVTAGFVPPVRPPPAPTELTATANYGQVILTWTASPGATNYTIKRSPSPGGPYTIIATNITSTSYTDTNVINGMTYYYVVLASNAGGESAISSQVSATPPIPPPPASISFGFASGEASSDFVGAPGQTFYAPVTLTTLPGTVIYSLQFNITVTNLNSAPQVALGAFGFQSMLEKPIIGSTLYYIYSTTLITTNPVVIINGIVVANDPIPGTTLYQKIPPLSFSQYQINPPPPSAIVYYDGLPFVNMMFTNTANNLLGVGWLERYRFNYLYDTVSQDLITYSGAHDTLFLKSGGKVIVGGYAFQVPATAQPGDSYRIQLGRPSATSDGIGAPGSDVYIATPTNGSLTDGVVNSIKIVTAGQRKYIAGDSAPFRWFNAGDFGNTNLDNSDVMQVFESAIYNFNNPPTNSDFFDSMDSCGVTYIDNGNGYLEQNTLVSNPNLLFNGNDTTINQIAFGDNNLDVCDVFVTYRRSLDPSLTWFRRYWSGGFRVAEIVPNVVPHALIKPSATVQSKVNASPASTDSPQVNFNASNFLASAGQTIQVPITAQIFGAYPLRVLMLNLTVVPLDGSPALTTPVQFNQTAPLGAPYTTDSKGNGNYSAVWLNSTIAGLTGTVTLGTLTVTIPANATSQSAYAIHFDHASASPNGIASFPKQTLTGLITLSNRSGSSYNDGIPDSWRLRYFLTLNNFLSQTNADADGDGLNNLQEYLAGTDPTDPKSFFKNIGTDPGAAQQPNDCVINWPSVSGKQYVIERSSSLVSPIWTAIATNSGTGTTMEYHDTSGGGVRFYRVRVQ